MVPKYYTTNFPRRKAPEAIYFWPQKGEGGPAFGGTALPKRNRAFSSNQYMASGFGAAGAGVGSLMSATSDSVVSTIDATDAAF